MALQDFMHGELWIRQALKIRMKHLEDINPMVMEAQRLLKIVTDKDNEEIENMKEMQLEEDLAEEEYEKKSL